MPLKINGGIKMKKMYYYLICYMYRSGDKKGEGRAFVGLDMKLDSFTHIMQVEEALKNDTGFNSVGIKSFQEVSQGYIGDDISGNKTYC